MPRAVVNAKLTDPHAESPAQLLCAYHAHQERTGRGNTSFTYWAKCFCAAGPAYAIGNTSR